ncbi:glutamate receptor ionotropic, delta-2-like [Lepeophtheirus salmonis]|uniref:glutamate receptor ionotropic, delta-2-like n=1 Tax=Lepeophtheirus salmonis TaxID=72036 RepID=UPI003AF3E807
MGRLLSPVAERAVLVNGVHLKQEIRNLRGITLRMVTLPWYPFIQMDCPLNLSLPCKCTGLAMDISNSLSDMMNFTLECYKEKSLTWGTLPLEDGKENGLMGNVINELYDLGPPVFYQDELRMNYVDFLKCTPSASAGFFYLKNSADPFLLFRPFTIVSWMSILGVIIPILGIVILLQYYDNNYHQTKSYRLLIFSISFLFVIVNAYYGGALTMFFFFFYNGGQCSFQFITRCGERPELGNNLYEWIRILSVNPD